MSKDKQNIPESNAEEELLTEQEKNLNENEVLDEIEDAFDSNEDTIDFKELAESQQALLDAQEQKIQKLTQLTTQQQEQVLREKAESENVRRRALIDVEKAHKFALEGFSQDLLTVVDNLERALQAMNDAEDENIKVYQEGIDMTLKSLLSALTQNNVNAIEPQANDVFDPNQHQAITMQPSEEVKSNHVIATLQKGYSINDRILRPAMVIVAQ